MNGKGERKGYMLTHDFIPQAAQLSWPSTSCSVRACRKNASSSSTSSPPPKAPPTSPSDIPRSGSSPRLWMKGWMRRSKSSYSLIFFLFFLFSLLLPFYPLTRSPSLAISCPVSATLAIGSTLYKPFHAFVQSPNFYRPPRLVSFRAITIRGVDS